MKKALLTTALLFAVAATGYGQKIAVRSNALGWLSAVTANAGVEAALAPRFTVSADGYYNPFAGWGDHKSTLLWAVQPEVKYWFRGNFESHYIGLHGQYSGFDAGLFRYRYEGHYWGMGLSYGYALPVADRWRLDFSLGVGWKHWDRDVYKREGGGWNDKEFVRDPHSPDNFGVTKVGVSAVFIIK